MSLATFERAQLHTAGRRFLPGPTERTSARQCRETETVRHPSSGRRSVGRPPRFPSLTGCPMEPPDTAADKAPQTNGQHNTGRTRRTAAPIQSAPSARCAPSGNGAAPDTIAVAIKHIVYNVMLRGSASTTTNKRHSHEPSGGLRTNGVRLAAPSRRRRTRVRPPPRIHIASPPGRRPNRATG
jgi:hypothetical protein